MTATFDGSTGAGTDEGSGGSFPPPATPDAPAQASAWGPSALDDGPESLLSQLRERVEERDGEEPQEWIKEVPRVGLRLVCDPDIDNADFQRWMKQATPRGKGRVRRGANPMDMDQLQLSARALVATNLRIEIKRGDAWAEMKGRDGTVLTLESTELLRSFNVMDSVAALKILFGRDSRVIDAGQELLAEAGYLGDEGDDDPV